MEGRPPAQGLSSAERHIVRARLVRLSIVAGFVKAGSASASARRLPLSVNPYQPALISTDQRSILLIPGAFSAASSTATRFPKLQLTEERRRLLLTPCFAGVAQLVEHHLAKVDVESSSLFARSILSKRLGLS